MTKKVAENKCGGTEHYEGLNIEELFNKLSITLSEHAQQGHLYTANFFPGVNGCRQITIIVADPEE